LSLGFPTFCCCPQSCAEFDANAMMLVVLVKDALFVQFCEGLSKGNA